MGTITIVHDNMRYVFEPNENETLKILLMLSGAKYIEFEPNERDKAESITPNETIPGTVVPYIKVDEKKWYNPKQKEVITFIRSRPQYRHTTKEILQNFNPGREINLSRHGDEANKNIWHSVLQKMKTARNRIEQTEHGKWIQERVGQEQIYTFNKY
jgi:hypothetical protein